VNRKARSDQEVVSPDTDTGAAHACLAFLFVQSTMSPTPVMATAVVAAAEPHPLSIRDRSVIARSLGEPEAFAEIFDCYWPALYAYCSSRAGTVGEDLAAETFRVAFAQRARFDDHGAGARPWLFGIATNLIRNHFRRADRGRRAESRLPGDPDTDTTDDMLGRVEADQLGPSLTDALGALPVNDRDALLLMAWADLRYAEIAAALHIPLGTVRSRIHRARRQLRAHLETTPDACTKDPR